MKSLTFERTGNTLRDMGIGIGWMNDIFDLLKILKKLDVKIKSKHKNKFGGYEINLNEKEKILYIPKEAEGDEGFYLTETIFGWTNIKIGPIKKYKEFLKSYILRTNGTLDYDLEWLEKELKETQAKIDNIKSIQNILKEL
jgi:hypothetical protein